MVKIYLTQAAELDIDSALEAVSEYRRSRVERLRSDDGKRASLAAELLLKHACGKTDYAVSSGGKPYFEDGSVHFSLSHCASIAVCAIADSPCGVDIERVPDVPPLAVAKRFFTGDECAFIHSSTDKSAAFCELWVKKEAIIKALGTGLAGLSKADTAQYSAQHLTYGEYRIGLCLIDSDIGGIEFEVQEDISRII